jgi:hypothetical protein
VRDDRALTDLAPRTTGSENTAGGNQKSTTAVVSSDSVGSCRSRLRLGQLASGLSGRPHQSSSSAPAMASGGASLPGRGGGAHVAGASTATGRVLSGADSTPLLVVCDTARCRALAVLQHLTRSVAARATTASTVAAVAMLFECSEERFRAGIEGGATAPGRVRCVVAANSPHHWPEGGGGPAAGCIRAAVEEARGSR